MPSSECAVPSRSRVVGPRVAVELPSTPVGDYTFLPNEAREWLGLTEGEMKVLVERSRLNRSRGLVGPLELVSGGSFTLRSVFAYRRRLLAATTH